MLARRLLFVERLLNVTIKELSINVIIIIIHIYVKNLQLELQLMGI